MQQIGVAVNSSAVFRSQIYESDYQNDEQLQQQDNSSETIRANIIG